MNGTQSNESQLQAQLQEARRRTLAEWRRVDLFPLEKAQQTSEKSLNDVIPALLDRLKLDQRLSDAEIVKVWNKILDPNISTHAQPVNLKNGTLFVQVDNSTWLSEIVHFRRQEILTRLQQCFGKNKIVKIAYRIG